MLNCGELSLFVFFYFSMLNESDIAIEKLTYIFKDFFSKCFCIIVYKNLNSIISKLCVIKLVALKLELM